jgi:hypothetical protein
MSQRQRVLDIINTLPDENYIRANWPFFALKKNSASPTIVFVGTEGRNIQDQLSNCPNKKFGALNQGVCIKTWCKPRPGKAATPEELALTYEKRVYEEIIYSRIHTVNPDAPFLKYLGDDNDCSTLTTLANFLSATEQAQLIFLKLALYTTDYQNEYVQDEEINYLDKKFYRDFFQQTNKYHNFLSVFEDNSIMNWRIGGIITPLINPVSKFVDVYNTGSAVEIFREIVKGLYMIHQLGLTHNDIHWGNIIIENWNVPGNPLRTLIYDWDRSYSTTLKNNPLLTDNPAIWPCSSSQCNLFFNERPIDLIKFLGYSVTEPLAFNRFLSDSLRIPYIPSYFMKIRKSIDQCRGIPNFFYNIYMGGRTKSSLCSPGHCPPLEEAIDLLGGTWSAIYNRAFPGAAAFVFAPPPLAAAPLAAAPLAAAPLAAAPLAAPPLAAAPLAAAAPPPAPWLAPGGLPHPVVAAIAGDIGVDLDWEPPAPTGQRNYEEIRGLGRSPVRRRGFLPPTLGGELLRGEGQLLRGERQVLRGAGRPQEGKQVEEKIPNLGARNRYGQPLIIPALGRVPRGLRGGLRRQYDIPQMELPSVVQEDDEFDFRFSETISRGPQIENSKRNVSKDKTMSQTSKSNMMKNSSIMKDMKNMMKKETKYLTKEMENKLYKLLKIPKDKLTWTQYFEIKDIVNQLIYGPVVPLKQPKYKSDDSVKQVPFYEVLEENENRKLALFKN